MVIGMRHANHVAGRQPTLHPTRRAVETDLMREYRGEYDRDNGRHDGQRSRSVNPVKCLRCRSWLTEKGRKQGKCNECGEWVSG